MVIGGEELPNVIIRGQVFSKDELILFRFATQDWRKKIFRNRFEGSAKSRLIFSVPDMEIDFWKNFTDIRLLYLARYSIHDFLFQSRLILD